MALRGECLFIHSGCQLHLTQHCKALLNQPLLFHLLSFTINPNITKTVLGTGIKELQARDVGICHGCILAVDFWGTCLRDIQAAYLANMIPNNMLRSLMEDDREPGLLSLVDGSLQGVPSSMVPKMCISF